MRVSRRLDEVATIIMGQAPPGESYNFEGQGWPLIAGASDFDGAKPRPKKYTTEAPKLSEPGDIILGIRATIGEKVLADGRYCLGRGVAGIRPSDAVLPKYLWYWLGHIAKTLAAKGKGATFKQVTRQDIGELVIELPGRAEQRRIADMLCQVESLGSKREATLALLRDLAQSIFLDTFGNPASNDLAWPKSTIGAVALQVTDGEHLTPRRESHGIKLLSARNIRNGYIELENVDYIGQQEYERIRRRCDPRRGDILISCSGTIGRVAVVDTDEPLSLVRSVALVRPDTTMVTTEYLAALLRTPALKAQMLRSANASSQANLFQQPIRRIVVPTPPLAQQLIFSERILMLQKLKESCSTQLALFSELFASLLHRAFSGEV